MQSLSALTHLQEGTAVTVVSVVTHIS